MSGEGGSGKKTILKIACKLLYFKYDEYNSSMNEKNIPKYYF